MKKLGIFLMSALALGFTACDDYDEAIPQHNDQAPIMELGGVKVAAGAQLGDLDLNTLDADALIELVKTVETPALNEGVSVAYDAEIAADENFSEVINERLTDGKIYVSALDACFRDFYGKTPNAKDIYVRFVPYFTDGKSFVPVKKGESLLTTKISLKPVDLGIVVEKEYYLVDAMFDEGWNDAEKLIVLKNNGGDVYDNPDFEATAELAAGSYQLMSPSGLQKALADPGNEFNYAIGPKEVGMSGVLVEGSEAKVINITMAGPYKLCVNMLEKTFVMSPYAPKLYYVGDFSAWSHKETNFIYERNSGVHTGFVDMLKGTQVKFSTKTDWSGTNYGAGDADGVLSADGAAGNITVTKGIYYFTLEVMKSSYKYTEITSWGVIGDATPKGWDDDTELTYKGKLVWEGEMTLTDGKIKFRANHDWAINLGGDSVDDMWVDGKDISVTAGTYKITLDLSASDNYKATLTPVK